MTVTITGLKTVGVSHNLLDVSGCIVTIGAMGCQKSITQQIVSRDADYVLAVKRNQGRLYEDLRTLQRRVKGWRSVMARRLVYASSNERAVEQRYRDESALAGTGISG